MINPVYLTDPLPVTWPGSGRDPLVGHREEVWRWDILTLTEAPAGVLDGVQEASLEWSTGNTIKGGGSMTWAGKLAAEPDWPRIMLQPWYIVRTPEAELSWPRGVFIPAATPGDYTDTGRIVSIELYDKLLILDQDKVSGAYAVAQGANVVAAIRQVIEDAGQPRHNIEDSSETLRTAMVWEPGTTRLRIVNDLLESINYFSLWADGYGVYQGSPYKDPQARPVVRRFVDDENSIYDPNFKHDRDTFDIPNRVIQVGRGDTPEGEDEETVYYGVAENTDPASPYSYPSRGRWIVHTDEDVEATSQAVINEIAQRRLSELSQVSSAIEFEHAHVPLELNDIVEFVRAEPGEAGVVVSMRATVQSYSISTETGALQQTRIREVAE